MQIIVSFGYIITDDRELCVEQEITLADQLLAQNEAGSQLMSQATVPTVTTKKRRSSTAVAAAAASEHDSTASKKKKVLTFAVVM
jgi:hypothetical protein